MATTLPHLHSVVKILHCVDVSTSTCDSLVTLRKCIDPERQDRTGQNEELLSSGTNSKRELARESESCLLQIKLDRKIELARAGLI